MTKKLTLITLLLFFIISSSQIFSQKFLVENYTEQNGLGSSTVYDIAQDTLGRIWCTTRRGVSVSYGSNWKNYSSPDDFIFGSPEFLTADSDGNIWVLFKASTIQIAKYDGKTWHSIPSSELDNNIYYINRGIVANNNLVIVATKFNGLFVYNNSKWTHIKPSEFGEKVFITDISRFSNGFLVSTTKGVYFFDGQSLSKYLPELKSCQGIILSVFKKRDDLWILKPNEVGYLRNNQYFKVINNFSLLDKSKTESGKVLVTEGGLILFGTNEILYSFDTSENKIELVGKNKGINSARGAYAIFEDREKNVWLSSERGLSKIESFRFQNYNSDSGLPVDEVTAITSLENELVLGHENYLTFYNGKSFSSILISKERELFNRTLDLMQAQNGVVWFAAQKSGFGYISKNKRINFIKNDSIPEALSLVQKQNGDIYGISRYEIYKYENKNFKKIIKFKPSPRAEFRKIFSINNQIWIVGIGYIFKENIDSSWTSYRLKKKSESNFFSLYKSGNKILLGGISGLYFINEVSNQIEPFLINGKNFNKTIYSINEDSKNEIWLGTDNGYYVLQNDSLRHFDLESGLTGLEANRDAFYEDNFGNIWLGTNNGLTKYSPQYDVDRRIKPKIILDSVIVNQNKYLPTQSIEGPRGIKDLELYFTPLTFVGNRTTKVKFYTEKNNEIINSTNWLDSKGFLALHSLSKGNYRFGIQARNSENTVGEIVWTNKITIRNLVIEESWFILLTITIIGIIIYLIAKYFLTLKYNKSLEYRIKKRTEEIKESEEKYLKLLENVQDGVFVIQKSKFIFVNNVFAKLLQYDIDELIGNSFIEFIAESDRDLIVSNYKRRQAGEDIESEYDFKMITKSGELITCRLKVGVITLNNIVTTIGSLKDITKSIKKELEVNKLFKGVEQSPVGTFITNPDGIIEYVNPKFSKMCGFAREELIGQNPRIFKSEINDSNYYSRLWETITIGKTWRSEILNKRKDGGVFWASVIIEPIFDDSNKIINYLALEEDITYEKFVKSEIEKKDYLINAVLNNMNVIFFAIDSKANLTLARGEELKRFQVDFTSYIGRSVFPLFKRSKVLTKDLKRCLTGEKFTITRKITSEYYEVSFTPLKNDLNEFDGVLGIAYNISDRIQKEKQLREAKTKAEKSELLQAEFLAQMSHEIRTPVNSILNFTALLKMDVADKVSDDLSESFDIIDSGGRRLARTIDMILNMSQIKTGTYLPDHDKIDLNEDVLKFLIKEFQTASQIKYLDLIYENQTKSALVLGDSYTIGQIFANLIDNAIKYTKIGSVKVLVEEDEKQIIVSVIDTGIGIKEEYIPHLFDAFSQEEQGYSRKFEGNGLGLALVKNYLELNNATIKVKSNKGKGTTFSVFFNRLT